MSSESDQFRNRAKQCRELAHGARDPRDRDQLNEMAKDLIDEADKMDAEEAAAPLDDHLANSLDRLETSQRLLKETGPKN